MLLVTVNVNQPNRSIAIPKTEKSTITFLCYSFVREAQGHNIAKQNLIKGIFKLALSKNKVF